MRNERRFTLVGSGEEARPTAPSATTSATSVLRPVAGINPQVEYIAEMLVEMEVMARRGGASTLAGILSLAQDEARRFAAGVSR